MTVSRTAVSAFSADYVTLTRNELSDLPVGDVASHLNYLTHVFVTYDLGRFYCFLRPLIPVVDMKVRAADSGLVYFDLDTVGVHLRLGDVLKPKTLFGILFD